MFYRSVAAFIIVLATSVQAIGLQDITSSMAPNPNGVEFFAYIPERLASPPPLIVAIHYCTGTAQKYYDGTTYAELADKHGFIVIFPSSPREGTCWEVHTNATLTHDGGGDSLGIASAVRYAIDAYGVNPKRVFATGTSSGAMMTNVLLGAYPDLFAAGSAYSGVPGGCFAGPTAWHSDCAQGQLINSPQYWGDIVRAAYPGYTGVRPRFAIWHGTEDDILYLQNFYEAIKQWTNVFGYSQAPLSVAINQPEPGYSNFTYGPHFYAVLAHGVGHTVPVHELHDLEWFGISDLTPATRHDEREPRKEEL